MTRCDQDTAHDREERKDGRQVTRFLIVEDHPLFREALESAVCLANPDAEILQATSIDGAIEVLSSTRQLDLVLLDLSMPGTTGLSGVMRVRKAFPKTPVVIVSGYEDVQIVQNVLALGVSGYIPKSTSRREIADAIGEVLRGAIYLPRRYRDAAIARQSRIDNHQLLKRLHDLTPQQLRVLDMLRKGLQNKQIAYELKICETTVKVHVSDILRKLSVFSRTNAIIEIAKIDFASLAGGAPGRHQLTDQVDI
jgi:DNA-binding NarL/FixJ family response regulator